MKSSLSNKRGQVQTIAPAIMALTFAAVVLIFGLVIIQELRDNDTVKAEISGSISNDSAPFNTTNSYNLTASAFPGGECGTITHIRNGSYGYEINSGNYTQTGCNIVNTTATFALNDWKIDYPYTQGGLVYVVANDTVIGLASFANFWEIIILAIVISIVIGLLLIVFGGRTRR